MSGVAGLPIPPGEPTYRRTARSVDCTTHDPRTMNSSQSRPLDTCSVRLFTCWVVLPSDRWPRSCSSGGYTVSHTQRGLALPR